jgi:anaerobic magnesium-protoporphyrin IX monomethyl ester cyclase
MLLPVRGRARGNHPGQSKIHPFDPVKDAIMKTLVINICLRPYSPVKMFPVGLGYIMTSMKNAGFDFDFLDIDGHRPSDADITRAIGAEDYDAICFGCIVTGYRYVKALTSRLRKAHPRAVIIAGNTVASSIPEILLSRTDTDVAVMAEGDETIIDLLRAVERGGPFHEVAGIAFLDDQGRVAYTSDRPVIKNLDDLPRMDFEIFDTEIYIGNANEQQVAAGNPPKVPTRLLPVNTARGCIAKCTFCYHAFQGKRYRVRSVGSLLDEISDMIDRYQLTHVGMSDELTFFSKKQALEFSDAVIERGLKFKWGGQCRASLFDSPDDVHIARRMKEAGCQAAFYSLESADSEILRHMNKKITTEQFTLQTSVFQAAGLPVNTSLVFGYPQETPATIAHTFDVCIENRIYPSIGYLLPQPGSGMYEYAMAKGLIPDEEEYLLAIGDRQDLYLNMTSMSDEQFEEEIFKGAMRCNEALGRGMDPDKLIKSGGYQNHKVKQSDMGAVAGS